jgi:hypothetical protein
MTRKYLNKPSKFNNLPVIEVMNSQYHVENGWTAICNRLNREIEAAAGKKKLVVIETYQGVLHEELVSELKNGLKFIRFMLPEE